MSGLLPGSNRVRIVNADRSIFLNNSPSALRRLPLKRIASEAFCSCALPDKAPEIRIAFGALAPLNASRHHLKVSPGRWRLRISVLAQEISAVEEQARIDVIGQCDQVSTHRVV